MARIIDNQTNIWGRQQGADPQRSDLWVIDFSTALDGLAAAIRSGTSINGGDTVPFTPPKLATYFSNSVALPELKTKPDTVRRDSRPYQMPSWDEPLEGIRMVFLLDCFRTGGNPVSPYRSDIYQMLNTWRAVVRAGRGSMSTEYAITLNANFSVDYAFDVRVLLLRPSSAPTVLASAAANSQNGASISNDLEYSMKFKLTNCWLGSFKMSELSYESTKVMQLETVFYAEDILQDTSSA